MLTWRRASVLAALVAALSTGALVGAAVLDRPATTLHQEVVVEAPRPVIWRLLSTFDEYEEWNPYIATATGAARRGAELKLLLRTRGDASRRADCDVVAVKKGRKLYWRCRTGVPGLLDREHVFRLLPTGHDETRTRIVYDGRWEGVLVPFTELGDRKCGYLQMLAALKRRAEAIG